MTQQTVSLVYPRRQVSRWQRILRAVWRDTMALWNEFQRPILIFVVVTLIGGFIYGELHQIAGLTPKIDLIDRPYAVLQLMVLSAPPEYSEMPDEWYLIIWWYVLPLVFVFIVGDGVAEFMRLFFHRDQRRNAWREAVASTYRDHIIVLGVGHVGLRVVRIMHDLMGLDVVAIDDSPGVGVEEFVEERRIPLIQGNGCEPSTLEKAGLKYADTLVVCTGDDRVNLDAIMRARGMNSQIRIVVRIWDDQYSNQIREFMNVQSVISSSEVSAPIFAGMALGVELTQTMIISGIAYGTMRIVVNSRSFMDGLTVGMLQDVNDIDIVLHVAKGRSADVKPSSASVVTAGDILVIFAQHEKLLDIAARNRYLR